MYDLTYRRAESLGEAAALLADDEAMLLAGGQTLIPTLKLRLAQPSMLIDISGLEELRGISETPEGIRIGACVTHGEIAAHPAVQRGLPGLAALAGMVGDPAVRHRGTIGGSLANNDPAACYPAAVLALGATLVTSRRELSAEDFFQGLFTTALEEGEILTEIRFPLCPRSAYGKFRNPASRFPLAGVFVAAFEDGPRVAVTGAGEGGVFRAGAIEDALRADFSAAALDAVEIGSEGLMSDIHADAEYRAALIRQMAKQAVSSIG